MGKGELIETENAMEIGTDSAFWTTIHLPGGASPTLRRILKIINYGV